MPSIPHHLGSGKGRGILEFLPGPVVGDGGGVVCDGDDEDLGLEFNGEFRTS
jgi:hypothetical protein